MNISPEIFELKSFKNQKVCKKPIEPIKLNNNLIKTMPTKELS